MEIVSVAEFIGVDSSSISDVVKGNYSHVRGYVIITKEDFDKGIMPKEPNFYKNKRKVLQIDIHTNKVINEFPTVRAAAKYIETHETHLGQVCKQEREFKGFIWKYKE